MSPEAMARQVVAMVKVWFLRHLQWMAQLGGGMIARIDALAGGNITVPADKYAQGYADGWIQAVERMANLCGLGEQANEVYGQIWAHWEDELLPWAASDSNESAPKFRNGEPIGLGAIDGERS
jgi:hypothetical protein